MSPVDLAISGDPGQVSRVGFEPDLWAWTPWRYATDSGNGRWDDQAGPVPLALHLRQPAWLSDAGSGEVGYSWLNGRVCGRFGEHLKRATRGERTWFKAALLSAGIESMTVHDLRHTAASLAVSARREREAVQRMLGHASAAMTLDVYADLFDDDLDAVADALDAAVLRSVALV
jgi:integrase